MNDCKLSGSQEIGGGEYSNVRCSGSVRINGDLKCESMHISGSCHAHGDIDCKNEIKLSGSFSADGQVKAQSLEHSGSASFGSFEGGSISSSGSLDVKNDVKAETIKMSGSVSCHELSADSLEIQGKVIATGQINADKAELILSGFQISRSESIVGSDIVVRCHLAGTLFGLFKPCLKTGTIEGDNIELSCVEADCVRGENIKIGDHCIIKRVEYSKSAVIDPKSQIGETVKI